MNKIMNKYTKGFTLIELLVVIAIIGILSSVVLASLNTARTKGRDASAKASMSEIRVEAEISYDTNGDYDGICTNGSGVDTLLDAAEAQGATNRACVEAGNDASYTAALTLAGGAIFCVDSTGFAGEVGSVASAGVSCQ